ncbi:hypothetical protein [Streptomyces seoulensis]|uniref:hypothetical protein n=1 Tax=Streptomyces seoulensis TaxID=73044 RepID=UPI001FCB83AD|nr:hypothetical protein [Streptomyces seoulensis]BDH06719.1 hypothetical protein HEK131_39460 [Streptomyces seoulensis]
MTVPQHDLDMPYAQLDLGVREESEFDLTSASSTVAVSGPCPRCHGTSRTDFPLGVVGSKGFPSRQDRPLSPAERSAVVSAEVLYCECGFAHTGLQEGAFFVGCGAYWRLGRSSGSGS